MKTKFQWNDKQRLRMIRTISMGASVAQTRDEMMILVNDIALFATKTKEELHANELLNKKLDMSFTLLEKVGLPDLYNDLQELENEVEEN